jgi:CBS-domain-containing membrane protein
MNVRNCGDAYLACVSRTPPAGADPLVVILTGASWSFLALPVLAGTAALATLYHRIFSRRAYPAQFRPA